MYSRYYKTTQVLQADLSSEADVKRLFDNLNNEWPECKVPDVLVVNHGIWPETDTRLVDITLEQWENTLRTNLTGSFLVVREFLKRVERYGHGIRDKGKKIAIIFVGSTAGKYGEAQHADYTASKSGKRLSIYSFSQCIHTTLYDWLAMMYGLMVSLKNEIVQMAPLGRVNCVVPGWVRTPMATSALANLDTFNRTFATSVPLSLFLSLIFCMLMHTFRMQLMKVAEPDDVAHQIVLLASPVVSGHVTGQIVKVDGGMEGRLLNQPK